MKYLYLRQAIQYVMGLSAPVTFVFRTKTDDEDYEDTERLFQVLDRIVEMAKKKVGVKGILLKENKIQTHIDFTFKPRDKVASIPRSFWEDNTIDEVYLIEGSGDYSSRTRSKWFQPGTRYVDLKFSKSLLRRIKWGMKFDEFKKFLKNLSIKKPKNLSIKKPKVVKPTTQHGFYTKETEDKKPPDQGASAEFIKNMDEIVKKGKANDKSLS